MVNGCGDSTLGQTMTGCIVISKPKSSTPPLPHKLDQAEKEWHKAQPIEDPWETTETGTFGEDGWSISTSYKPFKKDD